MKYCPSQTFFKLSRGTISTDCDFYKYRFYSHVIIFTYIAENSVPNHQQKAFHAGVSGEPHEEPIYYPHIHNLPLMLQMSKLSHLTHLVPNQRSRCETRPRAGSGLGPDQTEPWLFFGPITGRYSGLSSQPETGKGENVPREHVGRGGDRVLDLKCRHSPGIFGWRMRARG